MITMILIFQYVQLRITYEIVSTAHTLVSKHGLGQRRPETLICDAPKASAVNLWKSSRSSWPRGPGDAPGVQRWRRSLARGPL